MRLIRSSAAMALLLFGNGNDPAYAASRPKTDRPLFEAFQEFCVDTEARLDVITKAVNAADFEIRKRTSASTNFPIPMSVTIWDMTFGGHKMTLNAGHSTEPDGPMMVTEVDNCGVWSSANEDGSIAELRKWAGPPSRSSSMVTNYDFEVQGETRVPLKDEVSRHSAQAAGRAWHLTIIDDKTNAQVTLSHYGAVHPRIN
jgi:hypothetical protein